MPRWTGLSTARWCAAILLAVVVVSTAHAAIPDHQTRNDCSICKALHAPGLAVEMVRAAALPPPAPEALPPGPAGRPQIGSRGLTALRAPPSFS
jgi:hypothetical protein